MIVTETGQYGGTAAYRRASTGFTAILRLWVIGLPRLLAASRAPRGFVWPKPFGFVLPKCRPRCPRTRPSAGATGAASQTIIQGIIASKPLRIGSLKCEALSLFGEPGQ